MSGQSLEDAIRQAGSAVELLRNSPAEPHTFPVAAEFTNWRSEQSAWRESCALLDQSHHMTDLYISGPDAGRLLAELGVNSFANFGPGKAKQYVATNEDGQLIGDAVLFHLDEGHYDLVGHSMVLDWVQYHLETGSYNATTVRDENSHLRTAGPPLAFRYELQGPTAMAVMEKATGRALPETKFFTMSLFTVAGRPVRALRHGMAGQPGFELFGPWEDGGAVLDALLAAGSGLGLVRAGAKAYSTANLESGWIPAPLPAFYSGKNLKAFREWLPLAKVGSLGGSMDSPDITDYYVTPYDIGYGRVVSFNHDFIGRAALEVLAREPRRAKVTLVWNSDDVTAVVGTLYKPGLPAKYIELPKARYALHQNDKVLRNSDLVGISMDAGYLANEHTMVSLATIDVEHSEPGTQVTVVWGEKPNSTKPAVEPHRQVEIRATVAPVPYAQFARDAYRSR